MKKRVLILFALFGLIAGAMAQQTPQEIQSTLTQIHHTINTSDDGSALAYNMFRQQITEQERAGHTLQAAIWHTLLGNHLATVLAYDRWRLTDRTTLADSTLPDFHEWSVENYQQQIVFHFEQALAHTKVLQQTPSQAYQCLLDSTSLSYLNYRPTLYDIVAHAYLDAYLLSENAPEALHLLQSLVQFHAQDNDTHALISNKIELLKLSSTHPESEIDRIGLLTEMAQQYDGRPGSEQIYYEMGNLLYGFYENDDDPAHENNLVQAVQWFEKVVLQEPESVFALNAQNHIDEIRKASIELLTIVPSSPNQPILLNIQPKNCPKIYLRVIHTPKNFEQYRLYDNTYSQSLMQQHAVYQDSIVITGENKHTATSDFFSLPGLDAGDYTVLLSPTPFRHPLKVLTCGSFIVSDIGATYRTHDNQIEVYIFDQQSGAPIQGAKVTFTYPNGNNTTHPFLTLTTGKQGLCRATCEPNKRITVQATYKKQTLKVCNETLWTHTPSKSYAQATLFTDRSIYRPGQKLYCKAILVASDGKQLLKSASGQLVFKDNNYQTIATHDFTTNEYGSFSDSITIPAAIATGDFRIECQYQDRQIGYQSIRVEEYKRPTFEVTIEQPTGTYQLNQEVTLQGAAKAFAGYGISNAKVRYTVSRDIRNPWRWWMNERFQCSVIDNGEVTTDENGRFSIHFTATEETACHIEHPIYSYIIEAIVTDLNGETRTASITIHISEKELLLRCDLPEAIATNVPAVPYNIALTNLAQKPQSGRIQYQIEHLEMPAPYRFPIERSHFRWIDSATLCQQFPHLDFAGQDNKSKWSARLLSEGTIDVDSVNHHFTIPNLSQLNEGHYRITFRTQDSRQREIAEAHIVHLYQTHSQRCTEYAALSLNSTSPSRLHIGDTLAFTIGSYLKSAHVAYEIIRNDTVIMRRHLILNQSQQYFTYTVTENDLGHLKIIAYLAQNGQYKTLSKEFYIADQRREIDFDFIAFRDKTAPGSREEYQIRLHNHNGDAVAAELLCTLYDASLDAFVDKPYYNPILFRSNQKSTLYRHRFTHITEGHTYYNSQDYTYHPYYQIIYPEFSQPKEHKVCIDGVRVYDAARGDLLFANARSAKCNIAAAAVAEYEEDDSAELAEEIIRLGDLTTLVEGAAETQVRTHFNETALFYPHLRTDPQGNVIIAFTMPDALTRWNLLGFAHNDRQMSGHFERSVRTSKPLMVVPNAPRFFREGDTLDFSAKVVNAGECALDGEVRLSFYDALTHEPLLLGDATPRTFHLAAGGSREVAFPIAIPENIGAITYRIEAVCHTPGILGDGEEATLPVLSNRLLVTESLPVSVSGTSNRTFTFEKLQKALSTTSSTLRHHRLTFEFTPNPVWYAVQALPYLMEYPYECCEQTFSRYYANTLAAQMLDAHPRIREVLDAWNHLTPDAFCSNLDKNPELKQIILEQTPWLRDANNESASKQALARLFDLQRLASEGTRTCDKLANMQNSDGGWPWFADGPSSPYITQHIVAGLGHLSLLTGGKSAPHTKAMVGKALRYLDSQMQQEYDRHHKESACNATRLHYLYARSFYPDQKLSVHHREAYQYHLSNAKKQWQSQSLYNQALTALIVHRDGDTALARRIMGHLKATAQHSDEMGMWWKRDGSGYGWSEAPIERQALLIEAFRTIMNDDSAAAQMQLWLLKQKQTQSWPTTKATTEACFALLMGNDAVESDDPSLRVTVGASPVLPAAPQEAEAGTGYVKQSWEGAALTPEMATVTVEKQSRGAAWGALYWQYFEHIDKVTHSNDQGVAIEKKLFKVESGSEGERLRAITAGEPLRVGDKVRVRLVIRADRDLEYVHLKDLRAAAFEPTNALSRHQYQDGLWYYESTRDASTDFFIERLRKGSYVFEYTLIATQRGTFSNGLTTLQCMYAPEFTTHSEGLRVVVE